jgi:hypothetical protein
MIKRIGVISVLSGLLAMSVALPHQAEAQARRSQKPAAPQTKTFTYDEKVNEQMAKKLKIPVYFALPASARATLPASIDISDKLVDFKHPDGQGAQGDVGLRLVVAKRAGMAKRLAKSGLIQTGDILLTFRSEWGGAGAYPNVQMGISHTGVAFVKDGTVYNIDNPLNAEYLGGDFKSQLTSEHYRTLNLIHVIRPRNLSDAERANILAWSTRLTGSAKKIYPTQIAFNDDYNAPKFEPGKPVNFVRQLGQIGLGQNPPDKIDMYCSEFAWSLLSLRQCDPAAEATATAFQSPARIPSCVKEPMEPMRATGDYIFKKSKGSYSGLADGPLMVIDTMSLPEDKKAELVKGIFVNDQKKLAKMSSGHREVAEAMQPRFEKLETYYMGVVDGGWQQWRSRAMRLLFNRQVPDNYSPTSYLVNTLLPPDNSNRTMDYVATIAIE